MLKQATPGLLRSTAPLLALKSSPNSARGQDMWGKWLVLVAMIFGGCSSVYAADVPLGGITDGITPFSVPYPIQFSTLNWSAGIVNGSRWIGYLALYRDAAGTNVIATSTPVSLPGYGCNGDCGSVSFLSVISFAPNTTYYGRFIKTAGFTDEFPSFVIGIHPSGIGYIGNDPPYNANSVFYDTSDIQATTVIDSTGYGSSVSVGSGQAPFSHYTAVWVSPHQTTSLLIPAGTTITYDLAGLELDGCSGNYAHLAFSNTSDPSSNSGAGVFASYPLGAASGTFITPSDIPAGTYIYGVAGEACDISRPIVFFGSGDLSASIYFGGTYPNGAETNVYVPSFNWNLLLTIGVAPPPPTGTIQVTTNLPSATFTIAGPQNLFGAGQSASFTNVPAGTYATTYGAVAGYITPTSLPQTLAAGSIISFNAQYIPAPAPPVLVDPIPASSAPLLTGSVITNNTELLASQGTLVNGVAADGVAQVIIRIPANHAGEKFAVTIFNDQNSPSSSTQQDGIVASTGTFPSGTPGPYVTAAAMANNAGSGPPFAFAVYRAPIDFIRSSQDASRRARTVSLNIQSLDLPQYIVSLPIQIVRPPVMLIHGIWDNSAGWVNFSSLYTDPRFFVRILDYSNQLTGITATSPAYTPTRAKANSLGFSYNAPNVLGQINQRINVFKIINQVAAVQADIVAHSMGGDITRTLRSVPSFAGSDTFGKGRVHKLITIATPYLGTPLATQLLQASSRCMANILAENGHPAFSTVTFSSAIVTGAVGDLQGDGKGGGLSPALKGLQSLSPVFFPTALIAGAMSSTNLSGIDCTGSVTTLVCASFYLRTVKCPSDPLAMNLLSRDWPTFLGGASDSVVPVTSQLNNTSITSAGMEATGVIHTPSMEQFDFNGPAELDTASGIETQVILLLNEALTGSDYREF